MFLPPVVDVLDPLLPVADDGADRLLPPERLADILGTPTGFTKSTSSRPPPAGNKETECVY